MAERKIEVKILGDAKSLEKAFGKATRAGEGFGKKFAHGAKHAGKVMGELALAITAIGVVAGKSFAEYEEALHKIVGLAGGVEEEVHHMSDQILQLGPKVAKSPKELAEALYFVASSGVVAAKQMDVVTVSAKASAAGMGETQVVADAVTSAMNAYGGSTVSAANATDVLVAAVREGKSEAAALAPTIGTVAAVSAELGVKFEEVGAALASQTRLGIEASTAAVNLQAVFSSLLKVGPKTAKAMEAVGLSHAGLRKQLKEKGLLSVLQTLKDRFGDNTAAMAQAFPNIRALRGLLVLVGKNAQAVEGVFGRMAKSTGSLDHAFKTVTEGEAFKFSQAMATMKVIGIRLGAAFAPLGKKIADGLNAGLGAIDDVFEKMGKMRTIKGKLTVVWQGAQAAATGAFNAITDAIAGIDWAGVWNAAEGFADGIQDQLDDVDWSALGKTIGDGIREAVGDILPAAMEIAARLSNAVASIPWEQVGKSLGPGLASAIVTAFTTLMDPAFWIRNWDLALAVMITALTGPLGKIVSRLAAPLLRLGGDIVLRIGVGMLDAAPKLAGFVIKILAALPRYLAKAFAPLEKWVRKKFAALGKVTRFVVRVLGIQAVINAVTRFAAWVGDTFGALGRTIGGAFKKAFDYIQKQALRAAIKIIEPFTKIPGFLGGGAFKDLQAEWQATLDAMEQGAGKTATAITKTLSKKLKMPERPIPPVPVPDTGGRLDEGTRRGAHAKHDEGKDVETAAEKKERAQRKREAAAIRAGLRAKAAAKKAAALAKKAAEAQRKAYDELIDSLGLKLEIAGTTKGFADDVRAQDVIIAAIQKQIAIEGRTTELLRDLFNAQQERRDLQESERNARQFVKLGLTPEGEERIAGVKALQKRLADLRDTVKGTILDTPKTRTELKNIGRVLSGAFGDVSDEVRSAIVSMFDEISSALEEGGVKQPITRFRKRGIEELIKGMGLTTAQIRQLRSRMAATGAQGMAPTPSRGAAFGMPQPVTAGGAGDITVNGNIIVQDPRDADTFIKQVQKKSKRGAASRRGTRAGSNRGMS